MRRGRWILVLLPLLAACDLFGPSGPGEITARIEASGAEVGAAVLQVRGSGVRGFSAAGGSRIFTGSTEEPDTWRVVVVDPRGGGISFRIEVEDASAAPPSAVVFSASDTFDAPVPAEANVRVVVQEK